MQPLLPAILALLSVSFFFGAAALWLWRRSRREPKALPGEWALAARPVFSSDERRLHRQLRAAFPKHVVLAKLPLVRFCQPTDPDSVRYWYQLLGSVHVAFAICTANGRVLAAIDIERDRESALRALQIKDSALAACRVRYLRCTPDRMPSIAELQLLVPQGVAAARPAAAAPAVEAAAPRRARATLWQDSGFMQDSFFGIDGRADAGTPSTFGVQPAGASTGEGPAAPQDAGGVVIDTPVSPLRH